MRDEVKQGCPAGRIYGKSISAALAASLLSQFGIPEIKKANQTLSRGQLAKVSEYVNAHMSSDISLNDLTGLLRLSTPHFSRLFKNTVEITPYQYVLRERISKAIKLLFRANVGHRRRAGHRFRRPKPFCTSVQKNDPKRPQGSINWRIDIPVEVSATSLGSSAADGCADADGRFGAPVVPSCRSLPARTPVSRIAAPLFPSPRPIVAAEGEGYGTLRV